MAFVELRSGTARYVLFLEEPATIYRDVLEGRGKQRVDNQIRKFLNEATPESALQDEDKLRSPLRQLKSRGGNVRGLGVWCQGEEYDLFILQVLFDKDDEDRVYGEQELYRERGEDLVEKFGGLDYEEIEAKADEWRARDELILRTP